MTLWRIARTGTFEQEVKKYKKNQGFLNALDKKIQRLRVDPLAVGKYLTGQFKGRKSTRVLEKHRLIFRISERTRTVFLVALIHRKSGYER